jgi:hypothetical protein
MKKNNLEVTGFKELTSIETITIDGGHDGISFKIGCAIHFAIITLGEVAKAIIVGAVTRRL